MAMHLHYYTWVRCTNTRCLLVFLGDYDILIVRCAPKYECPWDNVAKPGNWLFEAHSGTNKAFILKMWACHLATLQQGDKYVILMPWKGHQGTLIKTKISLIKMREMSSFKVQPHTKPHKYLICHIFRHLARFKVWHT